LPFLNGHRWSWFHRHQRASGGFWWLLATSPDSGWLISADTCGAVVLCWGKTVWRPVMFGGSISRTQETMTGACIASFAMLTPLSSLICSLLREALQRTAPGICAGPGWSCWLMQSQWRPGCFCWVTAAATTAAALCSLSWHHWSRLLVSWQVPQRIFLFFFKIYLFIICKYTVAVFRHSRRGRQISLQMVVNHHVVAGIWTQDL
jgi:hypothetical protein